MGKGIRIFSVKNYDSFLEKPELSLQFRFPLLSIKKTCAAGILLFTNLIYKSDTKYAEMEIKIMDMPVMIIL